MNDRPTCEHQCRECSATYMHPMVMRKRPTGGHYFAKSKSVMCPSCRDAIQAQKLREFGHRPPPKYPPSLPSRPCLDCGEQHSRRRPDRRFWSRCSKCDCKKSREWQRGQVQREVEREIKKRIKEKDIDRERNRVARRVMVELVEVMRDIAPRHDTLSLAESMLDEWHP